jgi:hypothetical protein
MRAVLLLLLTTAAPAVAFDIDAYCRKSSDGDRARFDACHNDEHTARDELRARKITPAILARCEKRARSSGGAYKAQAGCVDEEVEVLKLIQD